MLKRKHKLLVISIICMIAVGTYLSGIDLTPVPKAKIANVDSSTVAKILCQKETELNDMTIVGGMGLNSPFKQAVDRVLAHNYQTVTAEYELELGFSAKSYCKDTILLDTRQRSQIILSVKCKRKDDTSAWSTGPSYLFGSLFSKYKRDYGREYVIMSETAKQLQADHQADIEWLGEWRPENSKGVWPDIQGAPSYLPTPLSQSASTPHKRDIELSEMNLYHIKETFKMASRRPKQIMKDIFTFSHDK